MLEQVIYLLVGAVLAMAGGFLQSWYSNKKERDNHLLNKREDAYLAYIDALLELSETDCGSIDFKAYMPKYNKVKAQLLLYSNNNFRNQIKEYDSCLYECFNANFNVYDVINKIDSMVDLCRSQLNIK